MSSAFDFGPELTDGLGRDMELSGKLSALDPAAEDPGYWGRFRASVMSEAARALAQRRLIADLTVADVLQSWSRAVVPAALAAAMAGLMLLRTGSTEVPATIEPEAVPVAEIDAPPLLRPDLAVGFAALGSEAF